jgi:phosphatidylethanolamine/phosphatidyl-N-methylethanolamine N-methyltransferase
MEMSIETVVRATRIVRKRYDRIAPLYDAVVRTAEKGNAGGWRSLLWEKVEGKDILEVGAGTGLNFLYMGAPSPDGRRVTAIDLSDGMLRRARDRAAAARLPVTLQQMDVQDLAFPDDSFDTVIGSFLFCSVPVPALGLREVKRVCRPGGKVVLLEHGLSENRLLAGIMNLANPAIVWITGAEHINRKIEDDLVQCGLVLENITRLDRAGIFKLIEARKPGGPRPGKMA